MECFDFAQYLVLCCVPYDLFFNEFDPIAHWIIKMIKIIK